MYNKQTNIHNNCTESETTDTTGIMVNLSRLLEILGDLSSINVDLMTLMNLLQKMSTISLDEDKLSKLTQILKSSTINISDDTTLHPLIDNWSSSILKEPNLKNIVNFLQNLSSCRLTEAKLQNIVLTLKSLFSNNLSEDNLFLLMKYLGLLTLSNINGADLVHLKELTHNLSLNNLEYMNLGKKDPLLPKSDDPSKQPTIDTYGANTTVQYITPLYFGKTKLVNNIPIIDLTVNNYLLFDLIIDTRWLTNHNLCVFTPYFYTYKNDANSSPLTIFGSVDQSFFFTKESLTNNKLKICCTSSTDIGKKYSKKGYYISKIPIEYLTKSTYCVLLRISTVKNMVDKEIIIRKFKTVLKTQNLSSNTFYTAKEIMDTLPKVYSPIKNVSTKSVIDVFQSINTYFPTLINYTQKYVGYKYLSNFADPPVNYAIISFYDSLKLQTLTPPRTPLNIQANNTRENYFITNPIQTTLSNAMYLYVVYINQYLSGAGITSNIQIYDSDTKNIIKNGTIITGPNLPSMLNDIYPFPKNSEVKKYSPYGIYGIPMTKLYKNTKGGSVLVTERISYGQTNYNYVRYSEITQSVIYIGQKLTNKQITTLQLKYPQINITLT